MAGGYVVYADGPSAMVGAGTARRYWQGPGRGWRPGEVARDRAPQYTDQHQARAALVADRPRRPGELRPDPSQVGYEWVPAEVEQPNLFPHPAGTDR